MKKLHIYHAGEPAPELRVELTRCRRFTAVVAIAASVYDEESDLYTVTEQADSAPHPANYGAIVEAIVSLRYSTGAEIALARKDDTDPEKQAYLAFVEAAKEAAKTAIGGGAE